VVATVLRLRYRILGNNLARRPWQLVGFCFGVLWALGLLTLVVLGFVFLSASQPLPLISTVLVFGGALLLLGWLLGPLLLAGLDATVDAARLAPFPLRRSQVMAALAATGLTGIPGIMTTVAATASLILWWRWPLALLIAVPALVVAVATCVVATQLMSALSQGGGSRRGRELTGTVVLALVILSGPILTGVLSVVDRATSDLASRFADAAVVLGWTPLGAAWAAPVDAAAGAWGPAILKLGVAVAALALLVWLWDRALTAATDAPARQTVRAVRRGTLRLFGAMPTGGAGATWARSLTAWLRDPRYLRQLLVVPLFPVIFAFAGGVDSWMFGMSAVLAALVLSIAGYADISYDGTAFASVIATGIRGRDDRLGRFLGAACVGVPLLLVLTLVTTAIAGNQAHLPALLGASLGLLLAGYGVTAVSSALIVAPVPAPGDSPFRSVPGQTFLNSLLVFVVWAAALVLATPALVVAAIATIQGSAALGWVALAVGVVVGVGAIIVGIVVGGRTLDRTAPGLLARIKAFPT
jgi:ABC-2 type transport system permease protein